MNLVEVIRKIGENGVCNEEECLEPLKTRQKFDIG